MNIILDASPLGIGFYHRQAQTGVSRVVEQLVQGLTRSPGVNLSLAALTHLAETMRYAQATFGAQVPTFVNRSSEQGWARLENGLIKALPMGSTPAKIVREAAYRTRKALRYEHASFRPGVWPSDTIYHSPFYPIPREVGKSVRTVQMIHDLIPIFHPEWFLTGDRTVRDVIAQLPPDAQVVTASQATKDDFCQHTHIDPARVTPIHLAASPALFYPVADEAWKQAVRRQYNLGDAPYLLSLATFEPRKNIDQTIRSFVELAQSRAIPAEVKLVLVGTKGWKVDKIMAELDRNQQLRSRLVTTGFVPDEQLAPLYAGALAFVYPSLYEGFGLPPLEAMQCGMPVITSNIPAVTEVVGDAAMLVAPTDTDALAQAMLRVVQSATLRTELSAKARARASQFSWDKFITEHVALYKRMT